MIETIFNILGIWCLLAFLIAAAMVIYAKRHPELSESGGLMKKLALVPQVMVTLVRVFRSKDTPRSARFAAAATVIYLGFPIDVVPDFLPVVGQLDDVIVLLIGVRTVIRLAGRDQLGRFWPGSRAGLILVEKFAGLHPVEA